MSDLEGQCKVVPGCRREWGLVVDGCGALACVLEVDGGEGHRIQTQCEVLWSLGTRTGHFFFFFCGKAGGCDILRGIALSLKLIP